MKKILVILLAAILCLTIVACTEEPVETNEPTDEATVEATVTETETETDKVTETETETETETDEESREVDVDAGWNAIFGGHSTDVDADDFVWVEGDAE